MAGQAAGKKLKTRGKNNDTESKSIFVCMRGKVPLENKNLKLPKIVFIIIF